MHNDAISSRFVPRLFAYFLNNSNDEIGKNCCKLFNQYHAVNILALLPSSYSNENSIQRNKMSKLRFLHCSEGNAR